MEYLAIAAVLWLFRSRSTPVAKAMYPSVPPPPTTDGSEPPIEPATRVQVESFLEANGIGLHITDDGLSADVRIPYAVAEGDPAVMQKLRNNPKINIIIIDAPVSDEKAKYVWRARGRGGKSIPSPPGGPSGGF